MTTEKQVSNTQVFFSELIEKVTTDPDFINPQKFQMKDVRDLQIVKAYHYAFSEDVPIYTRVNSLRLIAALEKEELDLQRRISSAFVYADYTVNPHSFEEVYEKGTPKDGFIGIKAGPRLFENSFMIIGNQNMYTLRAFSDMLHSTSKRLHLEIHTNIPKVLINERMDTFFKSDIKDDFVYGYSKQVLLNARIREMLKIHSSLFDPQMTNPKEMDNWIEFFRVHKGLSSYPFKTKSDKEISYEDITHEDPNLTDPKSYIAVIDDKRVTLTRQSGHGHTGVRIGAPETLGSVIERVKASAAGGGGAAKED